jgi:prepilin-type processing-associated H-X9-DG protein/prepilin-type N-terminal cleavage/methylation domain-containing protein
MVLACSPPNQLPVTPTSRDGSKLPALPCPATEFPDGGFTLLEMLVMLAIVAVLSSLLVAGLGQARTSAQSAQCQANLRKIGAAAAAFYADTGRPHPVLAGTLNPYMGLDYKYGKVDNPPNPSWWCPEDSRVRGWRSRAFGSERVSYGVNQEVTGSNPNKNAFGKTAPVKISEPSKTVHYLDATRYYCGNKPADQRAEFRHQGGTALNVLFHDGHVERFQAATPEARDALYEDLKWEP